MAGPISHTLYAQIALKDFLFDKDERQFIIGSLFPDIRYLKVISRNETHRLGITLSDVQNEPDSFRSGVLFHSLIDEKRENFVKQYNIYDGLPDNHLSTVAVKVCEDIKLYSYGTEWPRIIDYLKDTLPQEHALAIPLEKIEQWHHMHRQYFANGLPYKNKEFFYLLGFSHEQVIQLFELVNASQSSHIIEQYIDKLYTNLESILSDTYMQ